MTKPLVPIDPRGLDDVADSLLRGETRNEDTSRVPARIENPESHIILPGKIHGTYSYPDTLLTMDRVHLGKNWNQCHEALAAEDSFMPTIRQYMDFLLLLKSGNRVYDGKGNKVDKAKVNAILDDILTKRNPYRGTWLDADFKVVIGRLNINYNHRKVGRDFKPQNSEPLENCLMNNDYIDLGSANKQGLPTRNSTNQEICYWRPLEDNNSVARFEASSGRVRLICDGGPTVSNPGLGVRRAKILR